MGGQCRPFAASSGVYNLRRRDLAGRCIKSLASMPEARGSNTESRTGFASAELRTSA
jgi:hypothetical protein